MNTPNAQRNWPDRFWRWLTRADLPPRMYERFRTFFGPDVAGLQTHEKFFPGYDVASLFHGLTDFFENASTEHQELGSCTISTMRGLIESFKNLEGRMRRAGRPAFQRVAVDVEEEVSVVTSGLYLAEMKEGVGERRKRRTAILRRGESAESGDLGAERLAILLNVNGSGYWDGMETNHVPIQQVTVSVACRTREAADRFFADLDERRRANSVFRGKVIAPVVTSGMVHAVGFRAIKKVSDADLILPEEVKSLIERSIVGFCRNSQLLERLGVDLKRGILLHGPPGTGKTSICLYLAGLLPDFTICFVSGDQLLFPREICQMARYLQPAMVVFEDIDLIAQQRDANGLATVLGELMNQIDGCEPAEQVLFVMNTNSLDRLESAVRNRPGRVDQIVEVPLPDREARKRLLETFSRGIRLAQPDDMGTVLDVTQDMSPAMLKEIVKRAVVVAVERLESEGEVMVEEADLLLAARQVQALRQPLVPGNLGFRPGG